MNQIEREQEERAVLAAVDCGEWDAEASLEELRELAQSAGAEVEAVVLQKRPSPDPATCIGAGRLEELCSLCRDHEVDLIIFDRELTPTQLRNLEQETKVRVIDRTMLILDIFARRARSSEGKLQVELAQLQYLLPRLSGLGGQLSRLGGGIGTRGPGESQLETDRRHIRRRIHSLQEKLKEVEERRSQLRRRRKKTGVETAALVGYTNAGKSTLMNALTDAGVLAEDRLFATLDPTARALRLPDGRSIMLIDTVGLVRRLPHHLVEAFKSTLEEAAQADVILNVCDASSPEASLHLTVTQELLRMLGCGDTPILSVMNKCDLLPGFAELPSVGKMVRVSAVRREGLDGLLEAIQNALPVSKRRVKVLLPFDQIGLAAKIRADGVVESEEYTDQGLLVEGLADVSLLSALKDYLVK
jgi:GTP-binding protein HflX